MTRRSRMRAPLWLLCAVVTASTHSQDLPLSPWLDSALRQARSGDRHTVWIYLRDKGSRPAKDLAASISDVPLKTMMRRGMRGLLRSRIASEDVPLDRTYVDQILFAMRSTASHSASPDNLLGWGLVDAVNAVDAQVDTSAAAPVSVLAAPRR